jgi:biotin carboxylase
MKIVAVGTNRPCHRRLIDAGHEVWLAIEPSSAIPDDAERYAGVLDLLPDRTALASGPLPPHIDVVACYHDGYTDAAIRAAEQLNAPHQIDRTSAELVRDKSATRVATAHLEVGRVRQRVLPTHADQAEVTAVAAEVGYPLIVKPSGGEASAGVVVAQTSEMLPDAWAFASAAQEEGAVVLEELLSGREFSVETFSFAGEHHVLGITEKFTFDNGVVECGHLIPARLSPTDAQLLTHAARSVLDAVGIRNGAGHTELFLTSHGPRLVETHNRMGGDRIGLLVQLATGVDYTDLVARIGAGIAIDPRLLVPSSESAAAVWFCDSPVVEPKELVGVDGVDEARAMPGVHSVEVLHSPGTTVSRVMKSPDRIALAVATGVDQQVVLDTARAAAARLKVITAGQ